MLHGVDFGTYLRCENLYQGVLQSQSDVALQSLAALLYPGLRKPLREWEQLMVLQWWSQIKEMFSGLFPHFFKPASGEDGGGVDMADVMNSQIRALTGGDVTKESEILALDTWRALTELDAKAREAEEFKRKIKKK